MVRVVVRVRVRVRKMAVTALQWPKILCRCPLYRHHKKTMGFPS